MDYLEFISIYHQRIRMFHVKDAEFRPSGKAGVYGSYSPWIERPGRFRSLGDGQVDFKRIFSLLAQFDFEGWAVVEWECALKDSQTGAREGAEFVLKHIIPASEKAFDDFAGGNQLDQVSINKRILGI
jgi:sugar phosphate isomerase/epimerase